MEFFPVIRTKVAVVGAALLISTAFAIIPPMPIAASAAPIDCGGTVNESTAVFNGRCSKEGGKKHFDNKPHGGECTNVSGQKSHYVWTRPAGSNQPYVLWCVDQNTNEANKPAGNVVAKGKLEIPKPEIKSKFKGDFLLNNKTTFEFDNKQKVTNHITENGFDVWQVSEAKSFEWDFGDGTKVKDKPTVEHTYTSKCPDPKHPADTTAKVKLTVVWHSVLRNGDPETGEIVEDLGDLTQVAQEDHKLVSVETQLTDPNSATPTAPVTAGCRADG